MKTGLSEGEQQRARELGFSPMEYLLACMNAELNAIATKEIRNEERINYFVEQAKKLIWRIQLEHFYSIYNEK